jgi:hypothetical protein
MLNRMRSLASLNVSRIIQLRIPVVREKLDTQLTAMVLTKVNFLFVLLLPSIVLNQHLTRLCFAQLRKETDDIKSNLYIYIYTFLLIL